MPPGQASIGNRVPPGDHLRHQLADPPAGTTRSPLSRALLLLDLAGLRKLLLEVWLEVPDHRLHLLHAVTKSREGDEPA